MAAVEDMLKGRVFSFFLSFFPSFLFLCISTSFKQRHFGKSKRLPNVSYLSFSSADYSKIMRRVICGKTYI